MRGRFAPSPTGDLHLGNLRTALAAHESARARGGTFIVRMEDLDPVTSSPEHAQRQLADLEALGVSSDEPVVWQSDRFALYRDAIADLDRRGLVYPCFCTRREIREAAAAPHHDGRPEGAYPGTCRSLTESARRDKERAGRPFALRLRSGDEVIGGHVTGVTDRVAGWFEGLVDDVVLQRNDGVPAYNLAVVVDDALQGITEVVRGDDLLASTPRQVHLQHLLGYPTPAYAHLPLVVAPDGVRLAKRHGAVTLRDAAARGYDALRVRTLLLASLGMDQGSSFDWDAVPREPWTPPSDLVR